MYKTCVEKFWRFNPIKSVMVFFIMCIIALYCCERKNTLVGQSFKDFMKYLGHFIFDKKKSVRPVLGM